MAEVKKAQKIIAQNKKAWHDYFVDEKYEAGVVLTGTEIKSIRQGRVNLKDSYCEVTGGELFAVGIHISPYEQGNRYNHEPLRDKKLLMHRREIMKLQGLIQQKGYTLAAVALFLGRLRQGGVGTLPGQKTLRQAGSGRRAAGKPGHRPPPQGQKIRRIVTET